jgi:anti-sigma B factor antagonist
VNLEIKTQTKKSITLLSIKGEVDLYSSPEVRKTILNLTKKQAPAILVNLEEVNYMDSSGVATLIEGLQLCNKYKGHFALAGLRDNVREVFELTRLDKIFQIHKDVQSALKEFAP